MRCLKKQDGMIFVAALLGMLIVGAMGLTLANLTATNRASSQEDLQALQALYVAEGGMQYIIQDRFVSDSNFSDNISPTGAPFGGNPVNLSPGQFWVEYVTLSSSSATLRVTARVGNATRVVQQSVAQGGGGYQYVTVAGGNININTSTGDIYGDVGIQGQANVDEDVTVHGNMIEDPDIVIPTIDFSTYQAMTTSTHSGNKTINANFSGELYVTGNCTINANVTITGLLYCDGNVSINGNNVVVDGTLVAGGNVNGDNNSGLQFLAQTPDPQTHMPAILAGGNIDIKNSDNMQISGVIWSGGNTDMTNSDNLDYTGSYIVGGNLLLNTVNNIQLNFDADLLVGVPGLSPLDEGEDSGGLSLSGYQTH